MWRFPIFLRFFQRWALNGAFLAALASLCLVFPAGAEEGSGYRSQYDFPGQGDDWYASETAPDQRYDFFPTLSQPFLDGDEFDLGFCSDLNPYGHGPPLTTTQSSLFEYTFRHGALEVFYEPPGGGSGCVFGSDCDDGNFCTVNHACVGGFCQSPSLRYCGDADSCTVDSCDEATDSCVHTPLSAPGEIRFVSIVQLSHGSTDAYVQWLYEVPSQSYNVYRAAATDLGDLACLRNGITEVYTLDTDPLPPGGLFLYLVTGYGCAGESPLGMDSSGAPRTVSAACPIAS